MREFTTTAASAVAGGRAAYYVLYGWASYPKTPARALRSEWLPKTQGTQNFDRALRSEAIRWSVTKASADAARDHASDLPQVHSCPGLCYSKPQVAFGPYTVGKSMRYFYN